MAGNPGIGPIPEPSVGEFAGRGGGSYPTVGPQSDSARAEGMQRAPDFPDAYNPEVEIDPQAATMAQQASQSGHKDLFDVGVLTNLLQAQIGDSDIEHDMALHLKTIDATFRRLFSLYQHREDYEQRLGKDSVGEFEDLLRNCGNSMGDLYLLLDKNNRGEHDPLAGGSGGDLTESAGN